MRQQPKSAGNAPEHGKTSVFTKKFIEPIGISRRDGALGIISPMQRGILNFKRAVRCEKEMAWMISMWRHRR